MSEYHEGAQWSLQSPGRLHGSLKTSCCHITVLRQLQYDDDILSLIEKLNFNFSIEGLRILK